MVQVSRTLVASLFSGLPSASAVPPCWESTTAPVRRLFQDVNYGSTEVSRAVEEARLNQRRVALERQSANLVREYATYNADVSAHIRYNGLRDNANLFLPMPSGVGDPTSVSLPPSECWTPPSVEANPSSLPRSPSSSANSSEGLPSVLSRPWNANNAAYSPEPYQRPRVQEPPLQQYDYGAPAVQTPPQYRQPPSYREMPVYPPLPPEPTQVTSQPYRAYNSEPHGESILYQGRLYAPFSSC